MHDWFFTSDLHGQGALYEQLVGLVAVRQPRAVILGGDLAPHASGTEGVAHQRVFLQGTLVEFARRVRESSPATTLMLMMGNDDWATNMDCLLAHDGELWQLLHERVFALDGFSIAGLSWVPITPFAIKDWERWDDGVDEPARRLDGWTSRDGLLHPHRFDAERRAPTIADALAPFEPSATSGRLILVTHSPPHGTACDRIATREHVGSRAVRSFVSRHPVPLVLSGHIHESPRVSGAWWDRIDRTVVVNPGQFGTSRLCGVWFDPNEPANSLRHTVHEGGV
ncbi:MAG: metallophosphoesterase [Candidatus Eisenbacteria bacterium]|uniref:Metallophosphoesterase n=1 Tax=Eiseniibacteriota bacterium TaxID=2212470 RepID=A0A849SQZ7_UNCEI|nr:metallophosphoesterase [Candidatus Eisenbacteria bacterium]